MVLHVKNAGVWKPAKDLFVKNGGLWKPVRRGFTKSGGVWKQYFQDEVVATLNSTGGAPVAVSYFSPADWANPLLTKRLIIPAGQEIGGTSSYALAISMNADGQAGSFAADLIIDNLGIVSGLGGAPNSGVGGTAVWGNLPGRDGRKSILNNYNTLRGGGGGGGRGGDGGPGYYYDYQASYPAYAPHSYHWEHVAVGGGSSKQVKLWWGGGTVFDATIGSGASVTTLDVGGWRYTRGSFGGNSGSWSLYAISRQLITPAAVYTNGGAGGNGGRGQGYDGGNAGGAAGAAGGANAGAGGTGNWGGGWGATGYSGYTGASGNNGGGTAGAAGGAAGFYLNGLANITLNNFGTVQGRVA